MLAYIAGPYTATTRRGVQDNIDTAEHYGKHALLAGFAPLIPHRVTAHWDTDPQFQHFQHTDWMDKVCFPLLDACECIIMLPEWESSPGSKMEYQRAKLTGKMIYYFHNHDGRCHIAPEPQGK